MSERGEAQQPKRTRLPEVSKEDMISKEAQRNALRGYRISGRDPKKYPENFEKNLKKRIEAEKRVISLDTPDLTRHRSLEDQQSSENEE